MHLGAREHRAGGVRRIARLGTQADIARVEAGHRDVPDGLLAAEHGNHLRARIELDAEALQVEVRGGLATLDAAAASTIAAGVGRSGSPIPRLITSIPSCFLAAIFRSSSANRYGGT